jgi:ferredoxin-nitrite reductase
MSSSIFYSLRRTEKELQLLSEVIAPIADACPGLFYATSAQDGILSRIRIPGGILNRQQCEAIADLSDQFGGGSVQVTNRANLQIRQLQTGIPADVLLRLQTLGLAAPLPALDGIRNIMSSPTAGIDPQTQLDTRPLVRDWNRCLIGRPDFAVLSSKFSVCFDGGEAVSVGDRPNDIALVARTAAGRIRFRLRLSRGERGEAPQDAGVEVEQNQAIALLTALTEVYRDYTLQQYGQQRKPRLRELLQAWGVERYLETVAQKLDSSWVAGTEDRHETPTHRYAHLGIHPQQQPGLSYIGVSLSLGQLKTQQLRELAGLASQYGDDTLRLTPWQTVILPNVPAPQAAQVQSRLGLLELYPLATHSRSAMVACSGTAGCSAAATDTQRHAQALIAHLERCIVLDVPINIHFSGCEKSCAQHRAGDITLVGVIDQGTEAYHIYVGNDGSKFGRAISSVSNADALPHRIEAMIRVYRQHRHSAAESFGAFANRHAIADLRQLFDPALGQL